MTNKTSLSIRLSAISIRLLALCIVHCALCIPFSASATSITATATAVGAGDPTPVQATISGGTVEHLYLVYQISGSPYAWNTNEMTSVSATVYTGTIPPLSGAVTVEWYVTDGTIQCAGTPITLGALPNYNRYHDGVRYAEGTAEYGWRRNISTNWYATTPNWVAHGSDSSNWKDRWIGNCVASATKNNADGGMYYVDTSISMAYPTIYIYNMPKTARPFIRSPRLYGGVGTIDFRAHATPDVMSSEITLQVAYTDDEPTDDDWTPVKSYKFGINYARTFSHICHVVLSDYGVTNIYGVTYVRIYRSGIHDEDAGTTTSGCIGVDNICISKPPADVGIIEKLKNPGYPAADQNILMRCVVTNVCEDTPAVNRRVTVKYQYVARDTYSPNSSQAAWSSADMAYMGKTNGLDWYEGTIPTQRVGYVWYYYQVDYDGYHYGDNPITGESESISPAYWDAGEDTHDRPTAGTKFQVRPYRSRYSRITLEASPSSASVEEMTLVGDEQWQAVTLVSGLSVVSNYFLGYGYYEEDAEAYESNPVMWGENNPDALSDPTLAGFLESSHDTTVTNRLVALNEKHYTGFYLYRFSSNDKDESAQGAEGDRRYDYIVKKAVYQDFDEWTASPDYYEESLGGLPTLTYTENFDGNAASSASGAICVTNAWSEDQYFPADIKDEDFQNSNNVPSDNFENKGVKTPGGFLRTGSRILEDRKPDNKASTIVNKTVSLNLYGQIENTADSLPYGLEKITFRARASVDDRNFAVFKDGEKWNVFPKYVYAEWKLTDLAPSKPYFSYVLLYQPPTWGGASWYEVRIIQADSYNANNDTINVEVWRHKSDGTETRVGYRNNLTGRNLKSTQKVNVLVDKNGSKLRFRVHVTGGDPGGIGNNTSGNNVLIEDSSPINFTDGGAIGFGVFDAVPSISIVKAGTTNGGTDIISSLANTYSNWYDGGEREGGQSRWTITSSSITRTVPAQTINIYAADRTSEGETRAEPEELHLVDSRSVNSLSMTDFTVSFKAWNEKFVQIIYENGDGGIVLDDIVYSPWRAKTRCDTDDIAESLGVKYYYWPAPDGEDDHDYQFQWLERELASDHSSMHNHWAVLEGWVVRSGAFQVGANFERSRANTNLVQGIVSPELMNGLGSCSFSYSVSGGNVVYGVERTTIGAYNNWVPVAVYTNAPGDSGERYAKVGMNYGANNGGRLRVRIYGAADVGSLLSDNPACGYDPAWGFTDQNAKILIDNLRVKDYPEDVNDNAWNAYNLLITGDAPDGLVYNNSGKSCFFNNSPTNGVYGVEEFNDDDPYLESPPLRGVGVGEIAFQYRLVPGTADVGVDGHLIVKVAPDRDTPLGQWKTITNLTVSASGTAFVKFDNEKIFDEKNFVVRFYNSKEPGTPRIVIDNVLVTAPARASFEFEYVRLLPVQPLAGTNTVVEAKIMREIMNPKGIKIYVSYHKFDTNDVNDVWGVANWFDARTSPKVRLDLVGEKVYRTPENTGIPAFAIDDVVEFVVWGVHDAISIDGGDTPIVQGDETFESPEWYHTLNIPENEIVPMDLNVTTNALWSNTFNLSGGWSPYFWVYSCPPKTFFVNEINNWRTSGSQADRNTAEYIEFAGHAGSDIGGWRFMVFQNGSYPDMTNDVPAGTRVARDTETGWGFFMWADSWADDHVSQTSNTNYPVTPVFRVDAEFPNSANENIFNLGPYGGILVFRSNGVLEHYVCYGEKDSLVGAYWDGHAAGRKESQYSRDPLSLKSIDGPDEEPLPGATVDDFKWTTSGGQTPVAPNGQAQVFADLGGNVVVALYDPDGNEITDADVLDWIEQYGAGQSDIDKLTMDKFNEDFLLNLDLTKTCVAELKIISLAIEDGVVYIDVQLTRTEDNVAVGTRKINGTLKLLGRASLTTGAFAPLNAAVVGDPQFETGNTGGIDYELPVSNPPQFFKAIIE